MSYGRHKSPKRLSRHHARKPRRSASGLSARYRRLIVESLEPRLVLGGGPHFSEMVVFGDSLSDTGNCINRTDGLVTGVRELSYGRFTSGTDTNPSSSKDGVWHEVLGSDLHNIVAIPSLLGGTNYAYAGAITTADTHVVDGVWPKYYYSDDVGKQVSDFISQTSSPPANTLYTIWAGGNDLVNAADTADSDDFKRDSLDVHALDSVATKAVARLKSYILQLADDGARYFVWPDLPALDQIPHTRELHKVWNPWITTGVYYDKYTSATKAALAHAVQTFKQGWESAIAEIRNDPRALTIYAVDVYSQFNQMLNGTYPGYTFSNTTDQGSKATTGSADTYLFWDDMHPPL